MPARITDNFPLATSELTDRFIKDLFLMVIAEDAFPG